MVFHFKTHSRFKTLQKQTTVLMVCILLALTFIMYFQTPQTVKLQELHQVKVKRNESVPPGRGNYLIDTPKCKIVQTNLTNPEIQSFIKLEDYVSCSKGKPLLSYTEEDEYTVTLKINESAISSYSYFDVKCCYSEIVRDYTFAKPDDTIRISECKPFDRSVEITRPFIQVACSNFVGQEVYKHVHAIVSMKFLEKSDSSHKLNPQTTFNVLLVGIDSMSKAHLQRTMPKTYNFLETNQNLLNMRGFVKIGLNTLPNVMGMLSGLSLAQIKECPYCDHIDMCRNIWKVFRHRGYVTAYAEDTPVIGTFNYQKKGFHVPPTDLYFRPYMLAAERLGVSLKGGHHCAGLQAEAERIMELARDFQVAFKYNPRFGLFWMNSFSHDDLLIPSGMDGKVEGFLEEITKHLEDTIFFFFSDHGIRFGGIRQTLTGWLEERLPFSYLYLPESFKKQFQKEYNNVVTNSRRLTNPYDMYMTLQDIILLGDSTYEVKKSRACPLCHSLFQEVNEQRTCAEAGIDPQWCVCQANSKINLTHSLKTQLANIVVKEINDLIRNHNHTNKCMVYKLAAIKSAKVANTGHAILVVKTIPEAVFEGVFFSENFERELQLVTKDRIDSIGESSNCTEDEVMKYFCYCIK